MNDFFRAVSAGEIENVKKMKTEPKEEVDKELEKKLVEQNKLYHTNRAYLKENLKKNEMIQILEANKQEIPEGTEPVKIVFANRKLCILLF